jgi:hypothetical protein
MRKNVCVFCSSGNHIPQVYKDAARRIGELCAEKGINLINGAGTSGLMGESSDACLAKGGTVTGVIPQFMYDVGWAHTGLTELYVTEDMASRKQKLRDLSDGIITLAGGCGTMEELWESVTSRQLQLYDHPIIVLNTAGFYDPIKNWFETCVKEQFVREANADILVFADTPEEAVRLFEELPDRKHGDLREERH